jgi:hypothetical protein
MRGDLAFGDQGEFVFGVFFVSQAVHLRDLSLRGRQGDDALVALSAVAAGGSRGRLRARLRRAGRGLAGSGAASIPSFCSTN